MNAQSELWRVGEVAVILNVNRKRVYGLIDQGLLNCLRLSTRGIRISRRSLDKFIREREIEEARRRGTPNAVTITQQQGR